MDYAEQESCAAVAIKDYAHNARQMQGVAGQAAMGQQETELSSLLTTLQGQAHELRGILASILQRVSPQLPDDCAEKQCFSSGYVGRAEEIRSTLNEALRLLGTLAKLA